MISNLWTLLRSRERLLFIVNYEVKGLMLAFFPFSSSSTVIFQALQKSRKEYVVGRNRQIFFIPLS